MDYNEEPDFEDPSARAWRLHALKLQAKFDAYRQGVAKTFDVSLPTVDRWVTGENPPHPEMVKGVQQDVVTKAKQSERERCAIVLEAEHTCPTHDLATCPGHTAETLRKYVALVRALRD